MLDLPSISDLQNYLRENARGQYRSMPVPPFTIFFHPTDANPYFSYAIPDRPVSGSLVESLAEVREEFIRCGRTPRFEYIEAFSPDLAPALLAAGFHEEARQWSMVCTPHSLVKIDPPPAIELFVLSSDSPESTISDFLLTQRQGFNPVDLSIPSPQAIAQARHDFSEGGWQAYLARVNGQPAGVASFGRIIAGFTEIAGIATRVPFRRRGIAAFLTSTLTFAAFQQGAHTACLTAADAQAGRVYERSGYRPFSTMLAFSIPPE